eukprot:Hpha_TRINITY_DN19899_c0_g1::TRINITY_DN19899_c0_g1_i1::g.132150::m.132150
MTARVAAAVTASVVRPFRLRLALVRHGESENNIKEVADPEHYQMLREADPELSTLGRQQAEAVGHWFEDKSASMLVQPVHTVWVSPTLRTLQTCLPVARGLGVNPMVQTDIFESGGVYKLDPESGAYVATGGCGRGETE